jgi:hypothetical protein
VMLVLWFTQQFLVSSLRGAALRMG